MEIIVTILIILAMGGIGVFLFLKYSKENSQKKNFGKSSFNQSKPVTKTTLKDPSKTTQSSFEDFSKKNTQTNQQTQSSQKSLPEEEQLRLLKKFIDDEKRSGEKFTPNVQASYSKKVDPIKKLEDDRKKDDAKRLELKKLEEKRLQEEARKIAEKKQLEAKKLEEKRSLEELKKRKIEELSRNDTTPTKTVETSTPEPSTIKGKERILIVDDARFMRIMIRNILKDAGYEIVGEAETGKAAISLAKELKPDIITMDITMPDINGIQALEEILKTQPKTKIIMMSADDQSDTVREALNAGASDFISKPFEKDNVLNVLDKVCKALNVK